MSTSAIGASAPRPGEARPRRELTLAVLGGAAGAGAVLLAASRTWLVERTARPAPLPSLTTTHTGAVLSPVLPALAWVGLAAAVALLASRGRGRYAVGVVLVLAGLGVVLAAGKAATGRPGVFIGWALVCLVGAAMLAAVGVLSVLRGRAWPGLGARYDRHPAGSSPAAAPLIDTAPHHGAASAVAPVGAEGSSATPVGRAAAGYAAGWWDAIERGEDPTIGP